MLELNGKVIDGVVVLNPAPRQGAMAFATLEAVIELYLKENRRVFVLDLSKVQWVSSTSIAVLIHCWKKICDAGGQIALHSLTKNVERVLVIAKLTSAFEVYDTYDEAMTAVKPYVVPPSRGKQPVIDMIKLESLGTSNLEFAAHLHDAFEEKFLDGIIPYCILDFEGMTSINAMKLTAIITLLQITRERKGDAVFCNIDQDVMNILVICKLNTVTEIFESLEKAQQHFDACITSPCPAS